MLNVYQQRIVRFYTGRVNYDNDFTRDRALRHLTYAPPQPGHHVLDVATGTGFVAIAAANIVGETGSVIGIDFTKTYLEKAQEKIRQSGLKNIQLIEIDEAKFEASPEQFDRIYCSSAIVLFPDIAASLRRWHRWLKLDGMVAFTCSSESSFMTPLILQACHSQGIDLPNLHVPLGTVDRCHAMLTATGFTDIAVHVVDLGQWMSVADAKNVWNGRTWFHPNDPLPHLPDATLDAIKAAFDRQVEAVECDRGVWHEHTAFYVVGRKG